MKTLLKIVLVLVLWQTGILSSILLFLGGVLLWADALLQPTVMIGVL